MKNQYMQKGLYAAVFTAAAVQAQAAAPVDFSNLVEQVSPAVVNIRTLERVRAGGDGDAQADKDMQLFARLGILPEAREEHSDEVHQAAIEQALVEQKSSEQFYNAAV